ncbi:Sterol 3-beta-glucosyltransferase [Lobosporangium transversale]|uniref:sterol 3beta-glucosyltransferase n=1 Tax=Lobosporangium transversale TaxID=64571 RepID=A0A1Y2GB96_9FUNG|nr:hypothetical protein BCR41DRAFT_425255 [Lobosporangium transversale]KAF9914044.1 Sterol 3-beta-glucosyltransferase [Lobosporangium transversale]ORZ06138.1 hypothetical protein BCR41DRAFT_425255 [Lobosporangium transversale]|eukprot:XP_021877407.1 hypothetical protein BCR41DRAFT_425255 [Lobosporangium transversale]
MAMTQKSINLPINGSALLQFFAAAFRSDDVDSSSDEEDEQPSDRSVKTHREQSHSHQNQKPDIAIKTDSLSEELKDTNQAPSPERPSDPSPITKTPHEGSNNNENQKGTASGFSFGSIHDKNAVAQKLQKAFGYSKDETLVGEYSCWMARSVLLPGYMYLTTNHICFYANLPSSHDVIQKEGFFEKKSKNTKKFSRFWFILKNDVLSYYSDQSEIYYPIKTIDLKNALSAEPSPTNELAFNVYMTSSRRYKFRTDSELARSDWVKAIQKSIFHAKMNEENVKISIPLANVLEIEMNSTSFADTIRLSIKDGDGEDDEFFFAYFDDTPKTAATLKSQVDQYRLASKERDHLLSEDHLKFLDTTTIKADDSSRKSLATEPPQGPLASSVSGIQSHESSTSQGAVAGASWFNPLKYLRPLDVTSNSPTTEGQRNASPTFRAATEADCVKEKEICKATSETDEAPSTSSLRGAAAWLTDRIQEISATAATTINANSVEIEDSNQEEAFRKDFSLPEGEALGEIFPGYLLRVLPLSGRIYLSDNYICFKSTVYGSSTRVIVPLADVEHVDRHHGTRFYFHGLALLTKTDEEIFFEFSSLNTCKRVLNALKERITPEAQKRRKEHRVQAFKDSPSVELDDPMESRVMDSLNLGEDSVSGEPMSLASHPGFKPSRPLRITCLTIGSRGDVQPYIAFCKRLMEDGHSCRIATHGEYKEWIESHGIKFGHVGGDPGELIELCVENGMFTVSFIREGLRKFRGWLDDLMMTAWEACQDTDVLIESPSAIVGIHIAEALNIPYFRAFPFPWTRTRAFPHPFAVPERNLGRGYNYMSYTMVEQVFWKGISGQVNRWRKRTLKIEPTSLEKMEAHRVPFLYSWSPSLVSAPMDWHSWVHVTGYWFLDNPELDWTPPEGLEEFLEGDPDNKPVYIGFGSMVVSDPESMTKTIVDAVVESGVRAIVSKGWSDKLSTQEDGAMKVVQKTGAGEKKVYPSSVYMLKSAPHDWLFPRVAGVVHHGGAGTTAAGLRAGIPTVIKPFFGDQHFWAQRIEDAGVGVWCHDLTVKKLSSALKTITTNEKMIKKAQAIGEKIRAEDGVGTAIQYFYHDLAIAKQHLERIKKPRKESIAAVKDVVAAEEEEGATNGWLSTLSTKSQSRPTSATMDTSTSSDKDRPGTTGPDSDELSIASASATVGTDETIRPGSVQGLPHSNSASIHDDDLERKGSNRGQLADHLKSSATEPGPDRATELMKDNEKSAEGIAAQLEAMQPPHKTPPQFTLHGKILGEKDEGNRGAVESKDKAETTEEGDKEEDKHRHNRNGSQADIDGESHGESGDDGSSNSSKSDSDGQTKTNKEESAKKKKSKAHRVLGSLKMKAKKVKAHFKPATSTENTDTVVVPMKGSDAQR